MFPLERTLAVPRPASFRNSLGSTIESNLSRGDLKIDEYIDFGIKFHELRLQSGEIYTEIVVQSPNSMKDQFLDYEVHYKTTLPFKPIVLEYCQLRASANSAWQSQMPQAHRWNHFLDFTELWFSLALSMREPFSSQDPVFDAMQYL